MPHFVSAQFALSRKYALLLPLAGMKKVGTTSSKEDPHKQVSNMIVEHGRRVEQEAIKALSGGAWYLSSDLFVSTKT